MKFLAFILMLLLTSAASASGVDIQNKKILSHHFLAEMYRDTYYPKPLVDKGRAILIQLCHEIEVTKPKSAHAVYRLTHAATEAFNKLAGEFWNQGSEIETVARENIAADIEFILNSYGYNLDIEEVIAPREW